MTTTVAHNERRNARKSIPCDLDAERALLSAATLAPELVAPILADLPAGALWHPAHAAIAVAILELVDEGATPDGVTIRARLLRQGDDAAADALVTVLAAEGIPSAADAYAAIILEHHQRRIALALAGELEQAARDGHLDRIPHLLDQARGELGQADTSPTSSLLAGGDWILDAPDQVPAVWGEDTEVLWAEGEALIIAGPPGVGKTTLTGQIVWARIGLLDTVLGWPVAPTSSRVLYLALDRPRQIQRALARLAHNEHRNTLNERLVVRPGPLPDLAKQPGILTRLAHQAGADTVVIDSLKDAAVGLADDEVGAAVNRALQAALADGIEVLALHHQRKGVAGGAKPKTLEDLYGSTWIAAGAGSVVLLWGKAGDAQVELVHLKQPAAPVGPLKIEHDALAGTSRVVEGFDLLTYLRGQPRPVTTEDVARASVGGRDPDRNELASIRNKLRRLVDRGLVHRTERPTPGGGKPTALWALVDNRHET